MTTSILPVPRTSEMSVLSLVVVLTILGVGGRYPQHPPVHGKGKGPIFVSKIAIPWPAANFAVMNNAY